MFAFFGRYKVTINEIISFTDIASRIRLRDCSKLAINWKNDIEVTIFWHGVIMKQFWLCFVSLVTFSYWFTFHVFMSISSLALGLWEFPFISDWPEIRKQELPPPDFCPMSGDCGELEMPNSARLSLIKFCWMLQHDRVTPFLSYLRKTNKIGVCVAVCVG